MSLAGLTALLFALVWFALHAWFIRQIGAEYGGPMHVLLTQRGSRILLSIAVVALPALAAILVLYRSGTQLTHASAWAWLTTTEAALVILLAIGIGALLSLPRKILRI